MCFIGCEGNKLFCRTRAQFYPEKRRGKNKHETSARVEISQNADNADLIPIPLLVFRLAHAFGNAKGSTNLKTK